MSATKDKQDFTTRLMNDMDPILLEFIKTRVNSFIKWDLVRFFHDNPHTIDTAENIAKYAGRNASTVATELEELVNDEVIRKKNLRNTSVYFLATDKDMRSLISKFILASKDRHFRIKAVYHIIRGMR